MPSHQHYMFNHNSHTNSSIISELCQNYSDLFQKCSEMLFNGLFETSFAQAWNVIHYTWAYLSIRWMRCINYISTALQFASGRTLEKSCGTEGCSYPSPKIFDIILKHLREEYSIIWKKQGKNKMGHSVYYHHPSFAFWFDRSSKIKQLAAFSAL